MSKIKTLPQDILSDITPYLVTGEKIEQALLQDNKKPNIIWLISTNQAIILHGQQPNQKPAIMVMALDEIKEIDYLQKDDDIQVVLYSGVNNSKAAFHFEPSAKEEVEKFFLAFGDLITYRYRTPQGKIEVVQRALPIGDKERHVFGRGKKKQLEEEKPKLIKTNTPTQQPKENEAPIKSNQPVAEKDSKNVSDAVNAPKTPDASANQQEQKTENKTATTQPQSQSVSTEKTNSIKLQDNKTQEEVKSVENQKNTPVKTSQNPSEKQSEKIQDSKKSKELDYGNPVFFIGVTVISTVIGFFCLAFFKEISKLVRYFRKH